VTPSPAQFDYAKLDWMNGMYIRALPEEEFAHALILWLGEQGYEGDAGLVRKDAPLVQEKLTRLEEFPAYARFLFEDVRPDPAELDGGAPVIAAARDALAELEPNALILGGFLHRLTAHSIRVKDEPVVLDAQLAQRANDRLIALDRNLAHTEEVYVARGTV